jgi:hypothetical protein
MKVKRVEGNYPEFWYFIQKFRGLRIVIWVNDSLGAGNLTVAYYG